MFRLSVLSPSRISHFVVDLDPQWLRSHAVSRFVVTQLGCSSILHSPCQQPCCIECCGAYAHHVCVNAMIAFSLKANRPEFIRKGGLHHVYYLARTVTGDSGNAQKLVRAQLP